MTDVLLDRAALDRLTATPALFDALVWEDTSACVFVMTLTTKSPGVAQQRVTPTWPHHLPGDLVIALTGQAATIAMRRRGLIGVDWRGHGVRIDEARYSAPVLLGEQFFTRVELLRVRRWRARVHARFRFRMWKLSAEGDEIETFRSRQDAIFFPGTRA